MHPFQRPGMCVRSDNHAQVWPAGGERVDQLDGARGVTEAVTGNVEDENHRRLLIADCVEADLIAWDLWVRRYRLRQPRTRDMAEHAGHPANLGRPRQRVSLPCADKTLPRSGLLRCQEQRRVPACVSERRRARRAVGQTRAPSTPVEPRGGPAACSPFSRISA